MSQSSDCDYSIRRQAVVESLMIHTPQNHISVAEVFATNGVVYLRFKKPKEKAYEVMTLDNFLAMVYARLEDLYYMGNRMIPPDGSEPE